MARVYLKGLPQLKAKLIKLKERTATAVRPAMERAADEVVAMMKRLVPVDSGDLRDSIGWTFGAAPEGALAVATARSGNLKLTIFAGDAKAFYARWVEFGTAPGDGHAGTNPQPFFFPSWRAMRKSVKRQIAKAIRDAVRTAAR